MYTYVFIKYTRHFFNNIYNDQTIWDKERYIWIIQFDKSDFPNVVSQHHFQWSWIIRDDFDEYESFFIENRMLIEITMIFWRTLKCSEVKWWDFRIDYMEDSLTLNVTWGKMCFNISSLILRKYELNIFYDCLHSDCFKFDLLSSILSPYHDRIMNDS